MHTALKFTTPSVLGCVTGFYLSFLIEFSEIHMSRGYWNTDKGALEEDLFVQLVIVFHFKDLAECFSH